MKTITKTPAKHRQELAKEIYKWNNITLPVDDFLMFIFQDVSLITWSKCVGVTFTSDQYPNKEFHSATTINFKDNRGIEEYQINTDDILQ